jgi:hypothetical protein
MAPYFAATERRSCVSNAAVAVVGRSALFVERVLSAGCLTPVRCLNRLWGHPTLSGTGGHKRQVRLGKGAVLKTVSAVSFCAWYRTRSSVKGRSLGTPTSRRRAVKPAPPPRRQAPSGVV